ncbi:TDT family transporter (plasmid) [Clavibacter michiganensis subsp. michiganensis]|nr:TDT family transporter [Clavibacter michiganensis]OQJ61479.1 C4-dicarboxylate ABC transporter [Clavibacter michiganensis subsp. michiganensis]UDM12275.1 TDT family transporter [Clavibacter michiganensis subsp. michiganensis]UDM15388.1 TDT family transporter [Clavibacter michiganensis subsp. michiganensis]UDM22075.1 TDT family transporter [Clavibacter michiganensis subsp. michiganensis]WDD26958.1 TDT family transporter [Clavibacter michiganensis subsp. michiganensis]
MTTLRTDPAPANGSQLPQRPQTALFRDLERPGLIVSNLTPNWFASIMGTGIITVAAASLPLQFPGLRIAATVVWAIAAVLLVALTVATVLHWIRYRSTAAGHHLNPVISHFYGAPPMAFLTVGAGTLLLGKDWIGLPAAVAIDWVLWTIGTIGGLLTAVLVPYLAFTRHENKPDSAFGGWLMPIVPPMVSASTGALLLPYAPAGQARETLLWSCYGFFGLSLITSLVVITLIWNRLAQHKVGAAGMVPTLWIVLGPVGQSITAVNLLASNAPTVVDASIARALLVVALVCGFAMLGFALLWTVIALAITVRTAREHLPFSLTWWSFTFPVGTCVTGLNGLALHSGLTVIAVLAVIYYAGLVAAWITVALRTFHGSVIRGTLLAPPQPA